MSQRELAERNLQMTRLQQELDIARTQSACSGVSSRQTLSAGDAKAPANSDSGELRPGLTKSLSPDALTQARAHARASALEYLKLRGEEFRWEGGLRQKSSRLKQAFREMFSHQARVANLTGGRGLYQVNPKDTLSLIAGHALADSGSHHR